MMNSDTNFRKNHTVLIVVALIVVGIVCFLAASYLTHGGNFLKTFLGGILY